MAGAAREPRPTDRADGRWELMRVVIPDPEPGGRPQSADMREAVNALLYPNRAGYQWDVLPHDPSAKSAVNEYFDPRRDDGTSQAMLDVPREADREDHAETGGPTPSAGRVGSQTVVGAEVGGERGYGGGQRL